MQACLYSFKNEMGIRFDKNCPILRDSHERQDCFFCIRPEKSPCNQGKFCQHWKQLKLEIFNFSIFQGWKIFPWLHGLFSCVISDQKNAVSVLVWTPLYLRNQKQLGNFSRLAVLIVQRFRKKRANYGCRLGARATKKRREMKRRGKGRANASFYLSLSFLCILIALFCCP